MCIISDPHALGAAERKSAVRDAPNIFPRERYNQNDSTKNPPETLQIDMQRDSKERRLYRVCGRNHRPIARELERSHEAFPKDR
jgi:hypothetical protein